MGSVRNRSRVHRICMWRHLIPGYSADGLLNPGCTQDRDRWPCGIRVSSPGASAVLSSSLVGRTGGCCFHARPSQLYSASSVRARHLLQSPSFGSSGSMRFWIALDTHASFNGKSNVLHVAFCLGPAAHTLLLPSFPTSGTSRPSHWHLNTFLNIL